MAAVRTTGVLLCSRSRRVVVYGFLVHFLWSLFSSEMEFRPDPVRRKHPTAPSLVPLSCAPQNHVTAGDFQLRSRVSKNGSQENCKKKKKDKKSHLTAVMTQQILNYINLTYLFYVNIFLLLMEHQPVQLESDQ